MDLMSIFSGEHGDFATMFADNDFQNFVIRYFHNPGKDDEFAYYKVVIGFTSLDNGEILLHLVDAEGVDDFDDLEASANRTGIEFRLLSDIMRSGGFCIYPRDQLEEMNDDDDDMVYIITPKGQRCRAATIDKFRRYDNPGKSSLVSPQELAELDDFMAYKDAEGWDIVDYCHEILHIPHPCDFEIEIEESVDIDGEIDFLEDLEDDDDDFIFDDDDVNDLLESLLMGDDSDDEPFADDDLGTGSKELDRRLDRATADGFARYFGDKEAADEDNWEEYAGREPNCAAALALASNPFFALLAMATAVGGDDE